MVLVVTIGGLVGSVAACCRPVFVRWMFADTANTADTADTAPLEEVVVDSESDSGSAATFVCADEDSLETSRGLKVSGKRGPPLIRSSLNTSSP